MRLLSLLVGFSYIACYGNVAHSQIILETLGPDAHFPAGSNFSADAFGIFPTSLAAMDDGRIRFVSAYYANNGQQGILSPPRVYERSTAGDWSFNTLPPLTQNSSGVDFPSDISPNGRYVTTVYAGLLYDLDAGPSVEQLPAPFIPSSLSLTISPYAVANNGNVAGDHYVLTQQGEFSFTAVRYNRETGLTNLATFFLEPGAATGISGDGEKVVGYTELGGIDVPFIRDDSGFRFLPDPSGSSRTEARDISPNGRYIVGWAIGLSGSRSLDYVWRDEELIYSGLRQGVHGRPVAVADDGTVLFSGISTRLFRRPPEEEAIGNRPYIWRPGWAEPVKLDTWLSTLGTGVLGPENPFQDGSLFSDVLIGADLVVNADGLHILASSQEEQYDPDPPHIKREVLSSALYLRVPLNGDSGDPLDLNNGGFDDEDLAGWATEGPGTATVANGPSGPAAKLTTGSPIVLSQPILPPEHGMSLSFDYQFLTTSGILEVLLGTEGQEQVVLTLEAPNVLESGLTSETVILSAGELSIFPGAEVGLLGMQVAFAFDGLTGSQILIDNVSVAYTVPEPSTLCLLALSIVGLFLQKNRRRS